MKQKFALIAVVLITLLHLNSSAQHTKNQSALQMQNQMMASLPLMAEDGIRSITISDNVSVVLSQTSPDRIGVRATSDAIKKLSVALVDGNLFLGATNKLLPGERLTVFVRVNELQELVLQGSALVVSQGILQGNALHVSAGKEAKVSLKSTGKVWFDGPVNYQVENEKGYFLVNGL